MYIARKKKAGKERERERERERKLVSLHVSGRASNSFITRAKWVLRNWVLLAFTCLCQKQLSSFELIQFIARECKPSWREEAGIFSRPPKQFQKCFFSANLHPKSTYYPITTQMHFTTAFRCCCWQTCFLLFLSICLFPSSFPLQFSSFEEDRGLFDVKLCEC